MANFHISEKAAKQTAFPHATRWPLLYKTEGGKLLDSPYSLKNHWNKTERLRGLYRFIRRLFADELFPLCSWDAKCTLGYTFCKHEQVLCFYSSAKVAEPVFSRPWRPYHSLPAFSFVFKNGFYLALKCSQKKQMREQLCQLNVYERPDAAISKINDKTSKDKRSDF